MITVKSPFRISFAGGGSDISSFYKRKHGAVLSTTINKYMYIIIHRYFHDKIRIKYSRTEDVDSVDEIQHPLVRECLRLKKIEKGIEIASIADVPAGTGLGSSSAFTVGLLCALSAYKQEIKSKDWLAKTACRVEIEKVKEPIGKQDQYAVSFGGLNYIRFNRDESVFIEPVPIKPGIKKKLENNLLMFYMGNERKASEILRIQKDEMKHENKYKSVCAMVDIAEKMREALVLGKLEKFGELLHEGWLLKRGLINRITNDQLDAIYAKALKAGALGGKILGAGGGGFFLFYCEQKYQNKMREKLGLKEMKFRFDNEGTKVVYLEED